jgi:hypothetical protein
MDDGNLDTNDNCLVPSTITSQGCFHGFSWDIADREALVGLVSEILVSHHDHVLKILHGAAGEPPPNKESVIRSVLTNALAPIITEQDRYHRDGLLFQHISWIAAAYKCDDEDLLSIPHSRMSDKGQDILIVHYKSDGCYISIGEDKATKNVRSTVRDEVFPELKDYESGSRDSELESATLAILQRHFDSDRSQEIVNGILWQQSRRYRINVTVCTDELANNDINSFFAGYQNIVVGDDLRRRAETVLIPNLESQTDSLDEDRTRSREESEEIHALRLWFDSFARDIESRLQYMLGDLNV